MKPGGSTHHGHGSSESGWWQYNTVMKTGGWWYSSLADGHCNDTSLSSGSCSWRVAEVSKRVVKSCADKSFYDYVEETAGE